MKQTSLKENSGSQWHDICSLEDILPNTGVCALIENKQIAIFRIGESDEIYAVNNFDPIGKANVLSRGIVGDIDGELVVASPLYKQHFSLKSGQCLEDEEIKLNTYNSRVLAGRVQVS